MFIADITAVDAASELLDKNWRLALDKAWIIGIRSRRIFFAWEKTGSFSFQLKEEKKPSKKH